jgi:hypothetical protein
MSVTSDKDQDFIGLSPEKKREKLLELIGNADLVTVIELLDLILPGDGKYILLKARKNNLDNNISEGFLTTEEAEVKRNRITADFMKLVQELDEQTMDQVNKPGEAFVKPNQGNIWKKVPAKMELAKPVECQIRIALDKSDLEIQGEDENSDIRVETIRVSEVMELEVKDPTRENFTIDYITETEQFLEEDIFTEWVFYVTPQREGTHLLMLIVSVFEEKNGKERCRDIVLRENIEIVTTPVKADGVGFEKAKALNIFPIIPKVSGDEKKKDHTGDRDFQPGEEVPASSVGKIWKIAAAVMVIALVLISLKLGGAFDPPVSNDIKPDNKPPAGLIILPQKIAPITLLPWQKDSIVYLFTESADLSLGFTGIPDDWTITQAQQDSSYFMRVTPPPYYQDGDPIRLRWEKCYVNPDTCVAAAEEILISIAPRPHLELKEISSPYATLKVNESIKIPLTDLISNIDELLKIPAYGKTWDIELKQLSRTARRATIKPENENTPERSEISFTARSAADYAIEYTVTFTDEIYKDPISVRDTIRITVEDPVPLPPASFKVYSDQKEYEAAKINGKTWILSNITTDINGSRCREENDCTIRYYRWKAANEACKALHPRGKWRLPTVEEWRNVKNSAMALKLGAGGFIEHNRKKGFETNDLSYFWTNDPVGGSNGYYAFKINQSGLQEEEAKNADDFHFPCRCVTEVALQDQ